MIAHLFKDDHKMGGHKFSEFACNLLSTQSVFLVFLLSPSSTDTSGVGISKAILLIAKHKYQLGLDV